MMRGLVFATAAMTATYALLGACWALGNGHETGARVLAAVLVVFGVTAVRVARAGGQR